MTDELLADEISLTVACWLMCYLRPVLAKIWDADAEPSASFCRLSHFVRLYSHMPSRLSEKLRCNRLRVGE